MGNTFTISADQRRDNFATRVCLSPPSWISGLETRAMFKRYAINDAKDIAAAIAKRERADAENSHDFSHGFDFSRSRES
jgi:hypothetical protein